MTLHPDVAATARALATVRIELARAEGARAVSAAVEKVRGVVGAKPESTPPRRSR